MLPYINVGTGVACTARELTETVMRITGFRPRLKFDSNKPDGPARKLMDVSRLELLKRQARKRQADGSHDAYRWFVEQGVAARR